MYTVIRSCGTDRPKWRVAVILWHRQVQVQSGFFISTFGKSIEQTYLCFCKTWGTYWHLKQIIAELNTNKVILTWYSWTLYCNLFYIIYSYILVLTICVLDTLRMISIEDYRASIGRFYNRSRHFTNTWNLFSIGCKDLFIILICLLFSLL